MGKNRHSKDRLFVTQTEHKYLYGGKREEVKRAYRRLPFNCCALTLRPFTTPVCTREGHLFELEAIAAALQQSAINPVTGRPLALKELIKLNFSKNSDQQFFCPVTYKVFTDNSKIAAIATTGNVFSYDAIQELNIKAKNWTDLLSGQPFKRKDIIILQDPQDYSNREIENFEHLRKAKAQAEAKAAEAEGSNATAKSIRTNAATSRILQELEASKVAKRKVEERIQRGEQVSEKERAISSLTHAKRLSENVAQTEDTSASKKIKYSRFTAGECSRSFTSSAAAPVTENLAAVASKDELLEVRWRTVRSLKKKGYVRLQTNHGDINLEIHCDIVPQTADNFITLCKNGYYDGVTFHRIIAGFMMQGGDPTGTGHGGESAWKKSFPDEFDPRLGHDARGVLSMANSGPGTNNSQFFITFKACPHLDKKHSVFGRVVGGMQTLDKIENAETEAEDRPVDDVKIIKAHVFDNPFDEFEQADAKGIDLMNKKQRAQLKEEATKKVKGTVVKVGDDYVAYDEGVEVALASKECREDESVGKYLMAAASSEQAAVGKVREIDGKSKKKKTSGGFGDFSGW